jgi:hypothetical protein
MAATVRLLASRGAIAVFSAVNANFRLFGTLEKQVAARLGGCESASADEKASAQLSHQRVEKFNGA